MDETPTVDPLPELPEERQVLEILAGYPRYGESGAGPVRILFAHGYYDGPLDGVAALPDGTQCWFEWLHDSPMQDPRRYLLRGLTQQQLDHEWAQHRSFVAEVGTTTSCYHRPVCPAGEFNPGSTWWDRNPPQPLHPLVLAHGGQQVTLSSYYGPGVPVIGWYEW